MSGGSLAVLQVTDAWMVRDRLRSRCGGRMERYCR